MADEKGSEAASESLIENSKGTVLKHDIEDFLGDEDLFNFVEFPEEVESAIAEVISINTKELVIFTRCNY